MPWERIEKATFWLARALGREFEATHDIRADITLGTHRRLVEGMPPDLAFARAMTEARSNIIRNRVCGMTGRWQGLRKAKVLSLFDNR